MTLSWILITIALLIISAALILGDIYNYLSNLNDRIDALESKQGLLSSQAVIGENPRFKSRFK